MYECMCVFSTRMCVCVCVNTHPRTLTRTLNTIHLRVYCVYTCECIHVPSVSCDASHTRAHTQGEESAVDELAAIQRKMSNTKVAKARAAPKEAAERASLGKTIAQVGVNVCAIWNMECELLKVSWIFHLHGR